MNTAIEHPEITRTLRTGYPKPVKPNPTLGKCGCGCGEEITIGFTYIEYDDQYFAERECLMKFIGAVEVG